MNNKLTLAAVVLAHACVILGLTFVGGCKSTSGMEKPTDRSALRGSPVSSGFGGPGEVGGGYEASTSTTRVSQTAPAPVPAGPTQPASPVSEPAPAPGSSTASEPAPAPGSSNEPSSVANTTKPAPVSEEPKATGSGRTHVVRKNESLWIIAKREGISIDDLTAANGLKKNAVLKEGQKLVIPANARKVSYASGSGSSSSKSETSHTATASGDTYTVKSGDVLGTIARKHGVTTAALRAANNLKGDSIHVGQKLVIPGKKASAEVAEKSSKTATTAKTADKSAPAPAAAKTTGAPAPVLSDLQPYGAPAPAPAPAPEAAPAPAPVTAEPAPTPVL